MNALYNIQYDVVHYFLFSSIMYVYIYIEVKRHKLEISLEGSSVNTEISDFGLGTT